MQIALRLKENGPEPAWVPYARTKKEISVLRLLDPRPDECKWELLCDCQQFIAVDALITFLQNPPMVWPQADKKSGTVKSIAAELPPDTIIRENMSLSEQQIYQSIHHPEQMLSLQPARDNSWTLVTGCWDIIPKDQTTTLSLNQNLMIFCEPEMVETFTEMRSKLGLLCKTVVKAMPITALKLSKSMAKYECLQLAMDLKPFPDSTHYAWIDLSMGQCLQFLDRALALYRDKVSAVHIDYVSKPLCNNLPEYYKWRRSSMCSSFFTAHIDYMQDFCKRIQQKFRDVLAAGFGDLDEQLFPLVYFDAPQIFELYYGTAESVITNYERPCVDLHHIIGGLINRSTQDRDYAVARRACDQVATAWLQGHAQLENEDVWPFFKWNFMTAWYQNDRPKVQWILQTLSDLLDQRPELQALMQSCAADVYYVTDWALFWLPSKKNVETVSETTTVAPDTRLFIWKDGPFTSQSLIHQNPVIRPLAHRPAHLPA